MSTTAWPDTACLKARLQRAQDAAATAGVDALLVSPGSDLRYLLGVTGGSFERLTCLVVPPPGHPPTLVVPALEHPGSDHVPTDDLGVRVATWVDQDNPYQLLYDCLPGRLSTRSEIVSTDGASNVFAKIFMKSAIRFSAIGIASGFSVSPGANVFSSCTAGWPFNLISPLMCSVVPSP